MDNKSIKSSPECVSAIQALSDTLDILGGKWTLLIIHYLIVNKAEVNTFNKIEKSMDGISARMLSKTLKMLETNGIVERTELHTKPISVRYEITNYGQQINPLIQELVHWGMQHRAYIFHK